MSLPVRGDPVRRAELAAEIRASTGIDEAMIEQLVRAFYTKVRADESLAPIFGAKIADWEPHLQRMFAFWSSVALMSGAYHGQPMQKHMPLAIDSRHFDRWLALFAETARETCPPEAADYFVRRAKMIAESLELGVAGANGALLAKGERFVRGEKPRLARQ